MTEDRPERKGLLDEMEDLERRRAAKKAQKEKEKEKGEDMKEDGDALDLGRIG